MTLTIPPEFEQFVAQQLTQGEYHSAEEVVNDGLRVLQELKRREGEFRQDVQKGVDQLNRGEGLRLGRDGLRQFFDELQRRGRARYDASRGG
jgi:putative addiction module CopG family antidote